MEAYSSDFLEFWQIYPKKSDKWAAYLVWKKMTPLEKHAAKQAISSHVRQWQLEDREKRFIRDARRWLLQRNWEDEIDTVSNPQCFWNRNGNRGPQGPCMETSVKQDAQGNWYCKAHSFTLGLVVSR